MSQNLSSSVQQQLSNLFGTYRAEWLQEKIFDLFTEPQYFPELTTSASCVLVGGRGTGKTTVLRGLSYEGQFALTQSVQAHDNAIANVPFFGLYHRVNTNHVSAFQGADVPESDWSRLFAHYFNLLLSELILEFLDWYQSKTNTKVVLPIQECHRICTALHLPEVGTHTEIRDAIVDSRIAFEAYVNNAADGNRPRLSLQQAPVDLLSKSILSLPRFAHHHFFFLIDEYENLLDYQQRVVNTLIKHTSGLYYFKIGVKELGWTCRSTLNPNEQLISPADYALVRISDKLQGETFRSFAKNVCQTRLGRVRVDGDSSPASLEGALPGLTAEQEAIELGVETEAGRIIQTIKKSASSEDIDVATKMHPLELFFLDGWAKGHSVEPITVLDEVRRNPGAWSDRYNNNKYAALFAIRKGKRGIDKYYCGWDTFTLLAGGNIRYLLELVDQSFIAHLSAGGSFASPIPQDVQTKVAQRVGSMNLSELEGLSVNGARLTKLLLALGRVFQLLAAEPFGHAPEMNQFVLTSLSDEVAALLRNAVMHLALIRFPGTKLVDESDTLEYDYAVHPIFSALFEFSPRKKRKMSLAAEQIEMLITNPRSAIDDILRSHQRSSRPLPQQLTLFTKFFEDDK